MSDFDLSMTDKLLSTTRSVRKRLDLHREVDLQTVMDCLEIAIQAPTGSNKQGWRWIVVTDSKTRNKLAEIYREGNSPYLESGRENAAESGMTQNERVFDSAIYLAENLQKVPVHVVPCIEMKISHGLKRILPSGLYGSIIPAVWSFQLALRSRGLGSVFTTPHLEAPIKELLSIPEEFLPVALIPVAHTIGKNFRAAKRKPLNEVVHFNTWDVS